MKKHRILLLVTLLATTLFGPHIGQINKLDATENNTIYLNLTSIGRYNDALGVAIEEKFIENGLVFTASVGSSLPDESQVTSTSGATFVGWVLPNNLGGLQRFTAMPNTSNLILQAHFTSDENITTSGSTGSESSSEENSSINDKYLYLKGLDQDYGSAIQLVEGYSSVLSATEYYSLGLEVTAGFVFNLATPDNLSGLGAEILPTINSGKLDGIGYTLSADDSIPNATTNYLKVNNSQSSGPAGDGGTYYSFGNGPVGTLEFKVSGTFNIYITFWDNFGWARIYVEPAK